MAKTDTKKVRLYAHWYATVQGEYWPELEDRYSRDLSIAPASATVYAVPVDTVKGLRGRKLWRTIHQHGKIIGSVVDIVGCDEANVWSYEDLEAVEMSGCCDYRGCCDY